MTNDPLNRHFRDISEMVVPILKRASFSPHHLLEPTSGSPQMLIVNRRLCGASRCSYT
jgi:hypothetical protein